MSIELVEVKELFKGLRFSVERRTYRFLDKMFSRDVVVFPESVVILPLLTDDKLLLIKQFRPALNDYIYEVPAGVVENGEDVREAAKRELLEELGYIANELIEIGQFYPTPGYSCERMHFFIAKKLEYVGSKPEPYEIIQPITISLDDAIEMIVKGVINDLKTVAIILYYTRFIKK